MPTIRLIREITHPSGRGPGNGMYALQRALRRVKPRWLEIGGCLRDGEIPWFWCWLDRDVACMYAAAGRPFIIGPCMLFADWTKACNVPGESELCNAASCVLQFTESEWYRRWILRHCGPAMTAPVELFRFPIDPIPAGPIGPRFDLLIYDKTQNSGPRFMAKKLGRRFLKSVTVAYGRYHRDMLLTYARQSRACAYVSDNDRGPLALAEILLSGCPAVGIERGAPWIIPGKSGVRISSLDVRHAEPALVEILRGDWDRDHVREWALDFFSAYRTTATILASLDSARRRAVATDAKAA